MRIGFEEAASLISDGVSSLASPQLSATLSALSGSSWPKQR